LHQQVEEVPWLSKQPVEGLTVFTDASRKASKAGLNWQNKGKWLSEILEGPGDSLEVLELRAVISLFEKWPDDPVNIVSDSLYVVGAVERMERAPLKEIQNRRLMATLF
ncbi:PO113 protein, partial [Prunella fulvescens]|nr:PO113 protein [Prunella fulvescens]